MLSNATGRGMLGSSATSMNIAFITNHQKTELFAGIADRLQAAGHVVSWLSTGGRWTWELRDRGVHSNAILDISEWGEEWTRGGDITSEQRAELRRLEDAAGFSVNDLILMDRLLSLKPHTYALRYIFVAQREIRKALIDRKIDVVFGEATWAFELVTSAVCRSLHIPFYSAQVARIPDGRFGFFEGHLETELVSIRKVSENDLQVAREFYQSYVSHKPKPEYWHRNNRIPRAHLSWLPKLLKRLVSRHTDRFDETCFPTSWLIKRRVAEVVQARQLLWFAPGERPQLPPARPYVLYALHKQPESSVDVMGSYFSNQIELIRSIARSLPATHELYVKEHRNSIGDNTLRFYRQIKGVPGVRIIDPYVDSHLLIEHSDAVVSITGTIAYEAGLFGKPAVTVVPMYFGPLLSTCGCNPYDGSLREILKQLIESSARVDPDDVEQRAISFLASVYANSFDGIVSDPLSNPDCVEPGNLDRVSEGFIALLSGLKRRNGVRTQVEEALV